MKNTKKLFVISFFGCFLLPALILGFSALAVFFEIAFLTSVMVWILEGGGIWILTVYEILIISITVMLYLSIKLKDAESITTSDVARGVRKASKIKKVASVNIEEIKTEVKRKEVKVIAKRNIVKNDLEDEPKTPKSTTTSVEKPSTRPVPAQRKYPASSTLKRP